MALLQASRRVFAPVRSNVARSFNSLGPRETKQAVQTTSFNFKNLEFKKAQPKLNPSQEQDVQDHFNLSNNLQSKVPVEKMSVPMANIDSLNSLPTDIKVTVSTVADLEKYVQLCKSEGGQSREEVLASVEQFINVNANGATAKVATKITVGEARKQKQALPGGDFARKAYADKLFSSIGGNFGRQ